MTVLMTWVLLDDDLLYTNLIQRVLEDLGHSVLAVTDTAASTVTAINTLHPTGVILDFSADFASDYDVIATAITAGCTPIVFSQRADDALLSRYSVRPLVIFKPDISALEIAIRGLDERSDKVTSDRERRKRPSRAAWGAPPSNVGDSHSFYDALNAATTGDAILSLELADQPNRAREATELAAVVQRKLRAEDRLLATSAAVRVFLPAGGGDAVASILARLHREMHLPEGTTARGVTLAPGEAPADFYDRLRSTAELTEYRPNS